MTFDPPAQAFTRGTLMAPVPSSEGEVMRSSRGLVVLAAAVALVAAACGGSGGSAKGGAAKSSLPACPTGAIAKAAKPVHIVMWHSMTRANEDEIGRAHV